MFRDDKSVLHSSSQVHEKLDKRPSIISFHREREVVAFALTARKLALQWLDSVYFIPD